MTSEDDDWAMEADDGAHNHYRDQGIDLSHPINTGQKISELRELCDMTTKELAEKCSISNHVLLALEAGMMQLQKDLAAVIAENLGVAVSDIYEDDTK